jgi:hypothetical protein
LLTGRNFALGSLEALLARTCAKGASSLVVALESKVEVFDLGNCFGLTGELFVYFLLLSFDFIVLNVINLVLEWNDNYRELFAVLIILISVCYYNLIP